MNIHEQQHGAVTVVRPDGPIVEQDADQLKQRLLEALKRTLGRIVLDISAVSFVDSKGLEALVDVTQKMSRSGQWLKLCAAKRTLREVLELTGVSSQFEHFEDANSAVRSFL